MSLDQLSSKASVQRAWYLLSPNTLCLRAHHGEHGQTAPDNTPSDNKFYELRTYKIQPAKFQDFLKLTNEQMHLRMGHSKLIGYWTPDIGGLNQVFHIWEYECFAARSAVRAALAKDETWNSLYFSKALQMFESQENIAAKLLPWKPLQDKPFQEGGIYELRQYVLKPGYVNALKAPLLLRDEVYKSMGCGQLMGAFFGDIGHCNTIYILWNFVNADKRAEAKREVLNNDAYKALSPNAALTADMRSKIMVPLSFSPLN